MGLRRIYTIRTCTFYVYFKVILTRCSGEVGECRFITLVSRLCASEWLQWSISQWAYRLVDVSKELTGRELNFIVERRGLRDEETAISQLWEVWLVVARINFRVKFGDTSITNLSFFLTQVTHFDEGVTELVNHLAVVDWEWLDHIRSDTIVIINMKRTMTHVRVIASGMLCVDREPATKDIKWYIYTN